MFEGVEKTLEIEFLEYTENNNEKSDKKIENNTKNDEKYYKKNDLRNILSRSDWDEICSAAQCTIISFFQNEHLNAYLLSESSLFVYSNRLIMKTCGQTTILKIIKILNKMLKGILKMGFVMYRRRNLLWPKMQHPIHQDFNREQEYLRDHFPNGDSFILGPSNDDHWYLYLFDEIPPPYAQEEQTLEIMMRDCSPSVMSKFYNKDNSSEIILELLKLLPNSIIDSFHFQPCGYSANGLINEFYWTVHVTPEENSSYVSFETNVNESDYTNLVNRVISLFKPSKTIITLTADLESPCCLSKQPFHMKNINNMKLRNSNHSTFEGSYESWVCCYSAI
eukprot:GHVL01034849.1.p1 GENE.GHVL01034849.1~~GHVL01034849.1.p1  ORF type:complete len:346 (+),score=75.00 GHVL01034849.1:32-1039(+)